MFIQLFKDLRSKDRRKCKLLIEIIREAWLKHYGYDTTALQKVQWNGSKLDPLVKSLCRSN